MLFKNKYLQNIGSGRVRTAHAVTMVNGAHCAPYVMGGMLLLSVVYASAQNYPSRPIRLVVPQSAGGSTDLVARPLAQRVAEAMKGFVVSITAPARAARSAPTSWRKRHPTDTHCWRWRRRSP